MTARKTQTLDDYSDGDAYEKRHQYRPKSLAEQDAEWDRADRLRRQAEERAQRRQEVNA